MPIQSDDIKLLRSAVMADVPEGGGAATGVEVVDGQSNNLFPDTSTDDRAAGRFQLRKVFGACLTDDTDTALGAHFAVLEPPADPLVHVALFETPGWADERVVAQQTVERYMVKGPRYACRIMETHYQGSRLLQMYQAGGASFPAAGDAVAVRNPDGQEQYVRILKVTLSTGTFYATEGGGIASFQANVAVCELGQALQFDVLGPPIGRAVSEGNTYAIPYTTTVAAGAEFHGVRQLAQSAEVGDRSVVLDGGIYLPIVPAATIEEPLTDIAPLVRRQSLSRTGLALVTLPAKAMTLQPGTVLRLPTAAQPGTVSVAYGATVFSDNGNGGLLQGTLAVATIDYRARIVTFLPASPSYAANSAVVSYMPVTPAGTATHSDSLLITLANQSLAFTAAFEPPPAPGTFYLSYMVQGRWYDLVDNGNGKLAGADSAYGTGSINYSTGSIAYTMGAIPDVGSRVIYQWGDAAQAEAVALAARPQALSAVFQLDGRVVSSSLELSWTVAGNARSATCSASGVISGDATGSCLGGLVELQPLHIPDEGSLLADYEITTSLQGAMTFGGAGAYTLTQTPVIPGSVSLTVPVMPISGFYLPASIGVYDNGAGVLMASTDGVDSAIGTVNYTTGAVAINGSIAADVYERVVETYTAVGGGTGYYESRVLREDFLLTLTQGLVTCNGYTSGTVSIGSAAPTPAWAVSVPVLPGLSMAVDALAFVAGGQLYTAAAGVLSRGWDVVSGALVAAGSVSDAGQIGITVPPAAGQANTITWHNVAQSRAGSKVGQGVFRLESAPIKVGVFQLQAGALVGSANAAGVISGSGWSGSVDFQRGIVIWSRNTQSVGAYPWANWSSSSPVAADELTYNAVFLQYVPLDGELLGLETARLPLDGYVPGYRKGGHIIIHETRQTQLPAVPQRDFAYSLGRERVAAVTVRTATGARVPGTRYEVDFSAGTLTIPAAADLTGLAAPFTVHDRIEDTIMVTAADISGRLDLASALTHNYPAATSYVSSKLRKGDLFARAHNYMDRVSWAASWQATADATAQPTASFNHLDYPIQVTNRGAVTERWAAIFTAAGTVRVVGESVGQILTGASTNAVIAPINPQTGVPYFSINPQAWGGGFGVGNVVLFETAACGAAVWVARTTLQGPATQASDRATLMFGCDVDA